MGFNEKAYGKVVIHGHINSETQGAFVYADAATEEGYSSLELVYQGESHLTAKQAQIIKNKQVVGVKKSYDQVLRFAQGTIVPSSKSDSLHLIGEVDVRHGQNNKIDLGNKGTWLGGTVTSVAAPNSSSSNTADLNLVLGEGGHWTVTEGTYGLVRVVGGSGRIDIKTYEYESANQIIDLLDQKNILVVLSPEANNTRVSSIMNANKNITFKVDLSQSTSLDSKDEVLLVNMDETTRSVFGEEGKEFSGEKTSFYPETLVLHYDDGVYSKDYKGDKTQFKAAYLKRKPKGSSSSSSSSSTTPSSSPSPLVGEAHRLSLGLGGLVQLDSIVDLPVILTHGHGLWASATGSTMKLDDVRRKQSTLGVGFTQTHQTGKLSQEFGIGLHLTQAKAEDLLKTRRVDVSVFDQFTWNDRHHLELMLNVGRLKHRSDKTVDRFNTNVWGAMLSYNLDVMLPKHFKVIPTVALAFQHQSGYKFVGDHNIHYEAQSSNTSLAHVGLRTEWEGLTSMKPFVSVDHYVPLSGEVDLTASDGRSVLKDHLNKPKSWTSLAAGLTWNIRSNASVSAGVYTEMGGHRHNSFRGSLGLDWKF